MIDKQDIYKLEAFIHRPVNRKVTQLPRNLSHLSCISIPFLVRREPLQTTLVTLLNEAEAVLLQEGNEVNESIEIVYNAEKVKIYAETMEKSFKAGSTRLSSFQIIAKQIADTLFENSVLLTDVLSGSIKTHHDVEELIHELTYLEIDFKN
jgi:hypothetical protein